MGKTLKAIGEDIKEDGDHTGEVRDDGKTSGMMGKTLGRSWKMRKTSRVFPVFASRCHGSHVFPIFLEMSGKSSLPCLCLRCWGRHVFRVSPEMLEKTLGDVGEDIREDGDHTGEVRDDGEDIRDDREDIGEVREDEEDIAGLPCLCLKMSWKPCLPYLP